MLIFFGLRVAKAALPRVWEYVYYHTERTNGGENERTKQQLSVVVKLHIMMCGRSRWFTVVRPQQVVAFQYETV